MQPLKKIATMTTAILCATSMLSVAVAQGPVPIREASPGLLVQAPTSPALARLTAFGEFPGAHMVSAEIRNEASRLLYSFEFRYDNHKANEQVQIDAATGQVVCVEYSVEQNHSGQFVITGPSDLMALVESSYRFARNVVDENSEHGHVVKCRLRVQQSKEIFVFDVEVGEEHDLQQLLIDASTGILLSGLSPM